MGLLSITIVELYFLLFLTVILCRDSIESTPFVVVIAKKSWNGADFGSSDWRASGGCWRARLFPGSERARLKEAPKQICPPPAFAAADPDLVYSRSKTHPDTLRLALLYLLYSTTQINPSTSSSCSSLLLSLVTTSIRTALDSGYHQNSSFLLYGDGFDYHVVASKARLLQPSIRTTSTSLC
ncbi:hypothetical protein DTO280E4_3816 [Paecilomyces variotii]|nr:hypothetical protein DTO280E4_3816 [Paecilomyces variotii]